MWNKIQIWQLVTSIPKSEQGIVILLESLEHDVKAQKTASDFTVNELNSDEGMKILMNKLDSIFQNETTDEAYEAYIKFLNLTRKDHCDMSDYVLEFENLYKHGKEFRMNMLDPVLVFEHLDGSNAANNDCKLTLALGKDTKFDHMKHALKRLFSKLPSSLSLLLITWTSNIKEKEAFYAKLRSKQYKYTHPHKRQSSKHQPPNKGGQISRCIMSDSTIHWSDKYPHKNEKNQLS